VEGGELCEMQGKRGRKCVGMVGVGVRRVLIGAWLDFEACYSNIGL
jgi:hypothetical protein